MGDLGAVPTITLEHNNAFEHGSEELLSFLAEPGAEGMMHNMCCHELAIAVTFFGLRCDNIASVTIDRDQSERIQVNDARTDWVRVGFSIELKALDERHGGRAQVRANNLRFVINRCGGNYSCVHIGKTTMVHDQPCPKAAKTIEERRTFKLPCVEHAAWVEKEQAMNPDIRPYFLLQSPDYRRLKDMVLKHIIA